MSENFNRPADHPPDKNYRRDFPIAETQGDDKIDRSQEQGERLEEAVNHVERQKLVPFPNPALKKRLQIGSPAVPVPADKLPEEGGHFGETGGINDFIMNVFGFPPIS